MRRSPFIPMLVMLLACAEITGCAMDHPCAVAPSVTGQPSSQVVGVGQPAIFTVAAAGSTPLAYNWHKNGAAIPGANQATYVTPQSRTSDSGTTYSVTVSNSFGNLASNTASLTVIQSAPDNVRYVAPNGDDSGAGTINQPYRTIQHCAVTVAVGWTCEVRAGTYRETITPNSGITITSHNFELVLVDGSDPISGWSRFQGSIYKANVTLAPDDTNQIFVGDVMMTEARWPNGDDPFFVNWGHERNGTDHTHIADPKLPHIDWTGAKVHLWSGSDPFGHETGVVTASGSGKITIDVGQTSTCPYICPVVGGFYYLFGTLAALDAEREWYYESKSGTLYFMAPGGVNPNTVDVRAKRRQYAFDLRGRSNVTIRNISVMASTIVTDQASSNNTLDRINAQYVSHFTTLPVDPNDPDVFSILRVHFHDSGIVINGTGNTLQNSTIAYSAGAGVALEGNNNTIKNNLIHHVDYIGDYASGIDLVGDGNTIQYNTIHNIGRQGIHVTGVLNEDISYNNLFDSMMLSRDGGEIYACCSQTASGTRIHHNWLHDTQSLISGAADSYPLSGVAIDTGGSGFLVDQNVFWRNQLYSVLINGVTNNGPNSNNVNNNTIPARTSGDRIGIVAVVDCASTRVVDNRMVVDVDTISDSTACTVSNNQSSAPGATEMSPSTEVGCNFAGCSSEGPPAILDDGFVSPCPAVAAAKP
jgi:hypothetical protein